MSDSDILVRVENVSKKFCRSLKRSLWYGLKDMAHEINPFSSPAPVSPNSHLPSPATAGSLPSSHLAPQDSDLRKEEFYAVRDVSFELRRGECLGLIGRNGAGKTTLLKMLNGLIKPDHGRIEMRGRVGALIALGAGFNPILTGRENVYVNGSVLGLTKQEIDAKIEEIIDFSDIREFIDTPVQNYSSGMQVRLGFAVATAMRPDVLILDEVLAVGDASFRLKCLRRINHLVKQSAVIFVSHSMDQIASLASAVGLMSRGTFRTHQDPLVGIAAYHQNNLDKSQDDINENRLQKAYPPITSAEAKIVNLEIPYGGCLEIEAKVKCSEEARDVIIDFSGITTSEQYVLRWTTKRRKEIINLLPGVTIIRIKINPLLLHDGVYYWNFTITRNKAVEYLFAGWKVGTFTVTSAFAPSGGIPYIPDASNCDSIQIKNTTE